MQYRLSAGNPTSIEERQFASASEIRFTTFTSCIGVIAKKGNGEVGGVHLALMSEGDRDAQGAVISQNVAYFAVADVDKVTAALDGMGCDTSEVKIIGCISLWTSHVADAFSALVSAFATVDQYNFADGVYGAKRDEEGAIEITFPPIF